MTDLHYCVKNLEHQVQVIQKWIDAHDAAKNQFTGKMNEGELGHWHAISKAAGATPIEFGTVDLSEQLDAAQSRIKALEQELETAQDGRAVHLKSHNEVVAERDKALARVVELERGSYHSAWKQAERERDKALASVAELERDLHQSKVECACIFAEHKNVLREIEEIKAKIVITQNDRAEQQRVAMESESEAAALKSAYIMSGDDQLRCSNEVYHYVRELREMLESERDEHCVTMEERNSARTQCAKMAAQLREARQYLSTYNSRTDSCDDCGMPSWGKVLHTESCIVTRYDAALAEVEGT